jgi:isoleucyl-tRNA synthetase
MQRVAENYKSLRNTFKFLLGNLHDFDPAQHAVSWEKLEPLDQYMLARASELTAKVLRWYEEFEFHRIYHAVNEFAIVDLSALYADVLKDRLYTFAPNSPARRAAQTVLWKITEALARLVAPILSFLADEVWQYLPTDQKRDASVHTALFPKPDDLAPKLGSDRLESDFYFLLRIRNMLLAKLEADRQQKKIGKSLEAKVQITLRTEFLVDIFERNTASLKELYNISQVDITQDLLVIDPEAYEHFFTSGPIADEDFAKIVQVATFPADGEKCARCWNYRTDIGVDPRWPTVCGRCAGALDEIGFPPLTEEVPV